MKILAYLVFGACIVVSPLASSGCSGSDNNPGTGSASGGGTASGGSGSSSGGSGATGGGSGAVSQIVINEIMYNPAKVGDEFGEWLELINVGEELVDLQGWTLRDESASNNHVIATSVTVAPGEYIVLGRQGMDNGSYTADYVYGDDFKLANGGDAVVLADDAGTVVDSVIYGADSPWPLDTAGVSIELSLPELDNESGTNWQHAIVPYGDGDLGTPGAPNGGQIPGDYTIDETIDDWHQPDLSASLRFGPFDGLESHVLDELERAQTSIRLAFFNLRLYQVRLLLKSKMAAGVDVHVLLDKKQQDLSYNTMGEQLESDGVPVTLIENSSAENATMHDKFAIIDGERVITGSANYSTTALNKSDEDMLTVESSDLASRYQAEFDELISAGDDESTAYTAGTKVQAWMGPEDSLTSKAVSALDGASSTALIAMFDLNTTSLVEAIIAAHDRGVITVVVLDKVLADEADATADETLTSAGVPVILADNTNSNYAEMHSKFAVIDGHLSLVGSFNWTNLGSYFNDENLVVIDDSHLAARTAGKFAELLNTYSGPSASSLGLTTGPQTLNFELRNVTLGTTEHVELKSLGGGPFDPPVQLTGTQYTTTVEAGTQIRYRYEIHDGNSPLALEGKVHTFTVPYASGPFDIKDSFLK